MDELYSPDLIRRRRGLEWIVSSYEGPKGFENLHAAFRDYHSHIEELISEGDMVVARCIITGTHSGELFGIASTGKTISMSQVVYYRLREGKVIEIWAVGDELGLLLQFGIVDRDQVRKSKHGPHPSQQEDSSFMNLPERGSEHK